MSHLTLGMTNLLGGDGLLRGLCELLDGLRIVTEIALAADENDGKTLAEVKDFGDPLWEVSGRAFGSDNEGNHTFS